MFRFKRELYTTLQLRAENEKNGFHKVTISAVQHTVSF
jgi:hypothetical protein